MLNYIELDPIIARWIDIIGAPLHVGSEDEPIRCFYTPGDPPFECFQISIFLTEQELVKVFACAVDTNDDTDDDMDASWEGSASQLDEMLASAVDTVVRWKKRKREKPDPPSPW